MCSCARRPLPQNHPDKTNKQQPTIHFLTQPIFDAGLKIDAGAPPLVKVPTRLKGAMLIMNPEDIEEPVPDADAIFRFNFAEEAAPLPHRANKREASTQGYTPQSVHPPAMFPFNPHRPLFSHFPPAVTALVNETLDSPKRFQIVRRFPSSAREFKPNQEFETLFKIPYIYVQSQQKRQADFVRAGTVAVKLRSRLRRFLHRWRCSHLKPVNTDDIVTFEPPLRPIHIVDWARRQVYVFEMATLAQDIRTRLLNNDGFFEEPMEPRNPLTNLPLTLSQNIAVWIQFAKYPNAMATVVAGFRHSHFNLDLFEKEFNTILKLHALRTTLLKPADADGIERIEEFINEVYTSKNMYAPSTSPLTLWRTYAIRYYEADFLHINNPAMIRRTKMDIIKEIEDARLILHFEAREPPPPAIPRRRVLNINAVMAEDIGLGHALWNPANPNRMDNFLHIRVGGAEPDEHKEDDGVPALGLGLPLPLPAADAADATTVTSPSTPTVDAEPETPPTGLDLDLGLGLGQAPNQEDLADIENILQAQFELEMSLALALSLA